VFLLFAFRQGVTQESGSVARAYLFLWRMADRAAARELAIRTPSRHTKIPWLGTKVAGNRESIGNYSYIHCPNSA
jgi:hypothetical protein